MHRSKLLTICEAVQQAADAATEARNTPTVFRQARKRLLEDKVLKLAKQYQQEAMQEVSSELEHEIQKREQEGEEPKRYKNE